jgi:hypothetical protein
VPGGGERWQYDGKDIDYKTFRPDGFGWLDLSFFRNTNLGYPFPLRGTNCFDELVNLHSGGIRKHRGSNANGMFWFRGTTSEADENERDTVLYLLNVSGSFGPESGRWPENGSLMYLRNWTIDVENEGQDVRSRSCISSGVTEGFMTVSVSES